MTNKLTLSDALRTGAVGRKECAYQHFAVAALGEIDACDAVGSIFIATFGSSEAVNLLQQYGASRQENQAFLDAVRTRLESMYPALVDDPHALMTVAEGMLPAPIQFDEDNPRPRSITDALVVMNDELSMSFDSIAAALSQIGH